MWPRQSKHLKARDQNQKVERHLCFQRQGPVKHFIRRKSEEQEGDRISACGFLRLSFQEWMFTVDVGLNTFANLKLFSNIQSAFSSLFGYPARTSTLPPNACARMRAHVHLILESWAWKERASWRQVSVPKIRGFRVSSPESSFVWSDQRRWLTARSTAGPLLLRDSFASLPNVLETLESSLPDLFSKVLKLTPFVISSTHPQGLKIPSVCCWPQPSHLQPQLFPESQPGPST